MDDFKCRAAINFLRLGHRLKNMDSKFARCFNLG
jgi:hypothetical protein